MFLISKYNITIKKQLLLILNSINITFKKYFSYFYKIIQTHLNNTKITIKILTNNNQSTYNQPNNPPYIHINQNLLKKKLTNLSKLKSQNKYTNITIILTNNISTSKNSSTLSKNKKPFLYFINIKKTKNKNKSYYHQYKYIKNTTNINKIKHKLKNIKYNNIYFKF